jgi:purine-nucleoside phosphorylase
LNRSYQVGDLMVLKDHASFPMLSLSHPLIGPHDERFGPRFTAVNNIYKKELRQLFLQCGQELNIKLHEGVYGTVGGPTFETVTDARMFLNAGWDCVGMSTTHEAVVAYNCGLKVLAFSIVTDRVAVEYDLEEYPHHEEIVKVANSRARDSELLVATLLKKLKETHSHILD